MSPLSLFGIAPLTTHRIEPDAAFVFVRTEQRMVRLSAPELHVLSWCKGAKTLDDHTSVVMQHRGDYTVEQMLIAVNDLVGNGVLRPVFPETIAVPVPSPLARRSVVVSVITADRPLALKRCLESLLRDSVRVGQSPLITVIDGSRALRAETRMVVQEFGQSGSVRYVGAEEARLVCDVLAASGAPTDLLHYGLTPGFIGASRNLSLVMSAGEDFVTVDDDVVVDTWALPQQSDAIVFAGSEDVRQWEFYGTRDEAISGLPTSDKSILTVHQSLLGQSASDLSNNAAPLIMSKASPHVLSALAAGRTLKVRLTLAGLAGDSARYCPYRLLFASKPIRELLQTDATAFARALSSRETRQIARATVVSHDYSTCASYCMGIANGSLLPPFMPIGRGEDTVFAAMLAFADRDALFAHLPYGIVHDSNRASAYDIDEMPSARQTRVCELLLYLVAVGARPVISTSTDDRLRWLGRLLVELGRLDLADFVNLVGDVALRLRCQALAGAEASLGSAPGYWSAALARYRAALRDSVTTDSFLVPVEFSNASSRAEGFRAMQSFCRSFGEIAQGWSEIWATACRTEMRDRFWDN